MEVYARDFVGVARRSATEKTCFMVFFWGSLAEPFKSRMPYWHPEESLEEYVNREPTESAPEHAPFREPTDSAPESAPEPAPFREPTEADPEAHGSRSRARSIP